MEAFEDMQFESEIYSKLREAEREAKSTNVRLSSKDILKSVQGVIERLKGENAVGTVSAGIATDDNLVSARTE